MARNGAGVYSKPAGTTFAANTTILSAKVNEVIDDLVTDANTARPVVAGGTGATTVAAAQAALSVDPKQVLASKSGNYTALGTDNNGVLRFSAAATLSLTAAATLTANWHVTVIAEGGAVIIDPNTTELVNGASTVTIPQGFTAEIICDGSAFRTTSINSTLTEISAAGAAAISNYLSGFTVSNNGSDTVNDIDIAAGVCMDSTNTYIMKTSSSLTKRLDALWTVGTNQGGLDTGSAAEGTYHVFVIKRLDTGVVDFLFSTSPGAPTLPTNYTIFRRIASFTRSPTTIRQFTQNGDEFLALVPVQDLDISNQGTSGVLRGPLTIPTGLVLDAIVHVRCGNSNAWSAYISSPAVTDSATSVVSNMGGAAGVFDRLSTRIRTDTSSQIRTRSSDINTTVQIWTQGWIDRRGR